MAPKNIQLAYAYFEQALGHPLQQTSPFPVTGGALLEILWPLNDVFRPFLTRIRTIAYNSRFEESADDAIEHYACDPRPEAWVNLPGETWRVLLERQQQIIVVAIANEKAKKPVTFLPLGLPESYLLGGIMLLLLHSMSLPFPAEDRSRLEFPDRGSPSSLTLH